MHLDARLVHYCTQLEQRGLLRSRKLAHSDAVFFDSNDYLSLNNHPELISAYQKGYQQFPSGSGGAMVLNGYHANHQQFEQTFAQWLKVDECVLFSSGYAANLAIISVLGAIKASCLIDKAVHASIYDGLKLAEVPFKRYVHNSVQDADMQWRANPQHDVLITEGIFSMSGQISPLDELAQLAYSRQKSIVVDEAHSFGFLGHQGQGAVSHHGLAQQQVPLRVIPLGKAFAAQGAIVAGRGLWIKALMQAGRSFIYSTAVSPALCFGLLKTLELIAEADVRRTKLKQLIDYFRQSIQQSRLSWVDSETPIQQLQLACPHLALFYAEELKKQGFYCSAIRQPTVPLKYSGLRIILNYNHQPEHIDRLFKQLALIHANSPE